MYYISNFTGSTQLFCSRTSCKNCPKIFFADAGLAVGKMRGQYSVQAPKAKAHA